MKQVLFACLAFALFSCTSTDKPSAVDKDKAIKDTANYTTIEWLDSTSQDLGKIEEGQIIEISYKFRNAGKTPLVVSNVRGSCGCTGAEGPTQPVAPGKEGEIKAKFNSQNMHGTQHKEIYVIANNKNKNEGSQDVLRFAVEVNPKN